MRDGVKLATDVYRQDSATPSPALVTRTPYNKDGIFGAFDVIRAVHEGYVVVQDVFGLLRRCSISGRRKSAS